MNNIYKNFKEGGPLRGLARVSAILIMIMVWILIDKGNIYGQTKQLVDVISAKVEKAPEQVSPLFKQNDSSDDEGGIIDDSEGEGSDFQVYPNPVKQDLVFDFEFTVKETIPYQVISPMGRLVAAGQFEEGINTQMLDFRHLSTGMYIVRLEIGGETKVSRVIKE